MATMLIADDNKQISNILKSAAKKEGFDVILAFDGEEVLAQYEAAEPSVILLDVMMPKLDGFQVCREIRRKSDVPIIMVTARGEDFERIMGLDIGADDYIVKPFSPGEVMARVRAILRRVQAEAQASKVFRWGSLTVNLDDYSVTVDDERIPLTKRETDLLWTLAVNRNKAFSRENLLDSLWGYEYYGDPRTVDSHIKRLRAKLDAVPHPGWEIRTVRNVGYKFEVNDEK